MLGAAVGPPPWPGPGGPAAPRRPARRSWEHLARLVRVTPARLTAAAATGVQAVGVAAAAGYYVVELARGRGAQPAGVVSSVALFVVVALALGVLTSGWLRGAGWPRTATIVWDLVLVPVVVALVQAGQVRLAAVLGAVVVVAVGSALAVPGRRDGAVDPTGPDVDPRP